MWIYIIKIPFDLKLITLQAFGVGAFEDEDEDIYATEDMSNYDFGEEKKDVQKKKMGQNFQSPMVFVCSFCVAILC